MIDFCLARHAKAEHAKQLNLLYAVLGERIRYCGPRRIFIGLCGKDFHHHPTLRLGQWGMKRDSTNPVAQQFCAHHPAAFCTFIEANPDVVDIHLFFHANDVHGPKQLAQLLHGGNELADGLRKGFIVQIVQTQHSQQTVKDSNELFAVFSNGNSQSPILPGPRFVDGLTQMLLRLQNFGVMSGFLLALHRVWRGPRIVINHDSTPPYGGAPAFSCTPCRLVRRSALTAIEWPYPPLFRAHLRVRTWPYAAMFEHRAFPRTA